MAAYLVIQTTAIINPEQYERYRVQASAHITASGGEYLIASTKVQPLSGGWDPARIAVIKFANVEVLRACFADPAYRAIAPLRAASVVGESVIVED